MLNISAKTLRNLLFFRLFITSCVLFYFVIISNHYCKQVIEVIKLKLKLAPGSPICMKPALLNTRQSYFKNAQLLAFKFMMTESIHILLKFQMKEELFKSFKGWQHQKNSKSKMHKKIRNKLTSMRITLNANSCRRFASLSKT